MQQLWQQHGRVNIPTATDVIHQITQHNLNLDLSEFLHQALYATNELPVQELLNNFGIELIQGYRDSLDDKGGELSKSTINIEFGAQVKPRELGVELVQESEDTAAHRAGMMVGDIVIALDNWQVSKERLKPLLNNLSVGQSIEFCLLRDKKLKILNFIAVKAAPDSISLKVADAELCAKWLG
jgi:predicted metalloprotease with PDZ domain